MNVDWKSLKKFIDDTGLINFMNYFEFPNDVYVWVTYQEQNFSCLLSRNTADCEDFIKNYQPRAVLKNDISDDGMVITRNTHVLSGRIARDIFVVITTSNEQTNDDSGLFSVKLFDAQGHQTHDANQVVKTVVDFGPTVDYEIYGGGVESLEEYDSDIYVSGIMAPGLPGGNIYVVRNRLLKKPMDNIFSNGIGTGALTYNPQYPLANALRTEFKHVQGLQKRFQVEIQYYQ